MVTTLLILHGLVAVALLGSITHQMVSVLRTRATGHDSFVDRYAGVESKAFTVAIVSLCVVSVGLGGVIYPAYRLDVRIPFEDMSLIWAVGLFEIKEHFGGILLGILPLYAYTWRSERAVALRGDRIATTVILTFIIWWDFLVGHVLNNIRGLG